MDTPPPAAVAVEPPPVVCAKCGGTPIETGHVAPLCIACRDTLVRRPLPLWLRILTVCTLLLVIGSTIAGIEPFRAAINLKRGERAEQRQDYATAYAAYQKVPAKYADSTRVLIRLAYAAYHTGHDADLRRILRALEGRSASKAEIADVNHLLDQIRLRGR